MMNKNDKYLKVRKQLSSLIDGEADLIANLANASALLKEEFNFFWVGFYLVDFKSDNLVLGPFQGPLACTRIPFGKGVCGTAWKDKQTIRVDNVDEFPGHIACSSFSKSEIVSPIIKNSKVVAILDIDSDKLATFDEIDAQNLEQISLILSDIFL